MHADFSRVTFQPGKHYSAVLAQQGRVQLDADANEQAAIELHRTRTLAADLIGPHGGPAAEPRSFKIGYLAGNHEADDLSIGGGRYYVDGILCEATRPQPGTAVPDDGNWQQGDGTDGQGTHAWWTYWEQPDAYRDRERAEDQLPDQFPYLVYLKVWERSVTAVEDPEIREVALGSAMPDTAARAKVVWQVLALPKEKLGVAGAEADQVRSAFGTWAGQQLAPSAWLAARTQRPEHADEDPCLVHPEAGYRAPENQLVRVEIHDGGTAQAQDGATFKWSLENGSVVFPIAAVEGSWIDLTTLGGDDKLTLDPGDLVEVCDSAYISRGEPAALLRVEEIDQPGRRVRLSDAPAPGVGRLAEHHPFLRRWDHRPMTGHDALKSARGALQIKERTWIDLADGIQVYFRPGGEYRSGDYWIIPARTVTGTVEWPRNSAGDPLLQAPVGIQVHYAPLAWVERPEHVVDLRCLFAPLAAPVQPGGEG